MSDDHARDRLRRAVEHAAEDDENQPARQRSSGVAIAVLALLVVGLLIALISGDLPRP